jgi:small subunit ribosomal protein S11
MAENTAKKKKKDIKIVSWILHVNTSSNNTIITLADQQWNKLFGAWTWSVGFKWSKENTPYAAEVLTKKILKDAKDRGLKEIWIVFTWVWMWRDWVFKWISETWMIEIQYVKENTPLKFGGVKGYRPKRV